MSDPSPSQKPEFPPLLDVGLHPLTLVELESLCVDQFPLSETRKEIFDALKTIIERLADTKIPGELWVDGSFLTKKTNPADVDLVFSIRASDYEQAKEEQREIVESLSVNDDTTGLCDSYVLVLYDLSDDLYWFGEFMRAYWIRQFGFSRGQDMKGIAVIAIQQKK